MMAVTRDPDPGTSRESAWEGPVAALDSAVAQFGGQTALRMRRGAWIEVTYAELSARAKALASFLIEAGIEPGDRVAIISEPRPEWLVVLFATARAGAIVVPLDPKLGEQE